MPPLEFRPVCIFLFYALIVKEKDIEKKTLKIRKILLKFWSKISNDHAVTYIGF